MKKFFAETTCYKDEIEKDLAKTYLLHWKNNLIRKLNREASGVRLIDEIWGERPGYFRDQFTETTDIYLKICLEFEFDYELNYRAIG